MRKCKVVIIVITIYGAIISAILLMGGIVKHYLSSNPLRTIIQLLESAFKN